MALPVYNSKEVLLIAQITDGQLRNFYREKMIRDPFSQHMPRCLNFTRLEIAQMYFIQRLIDHGVPRTREKQKYAAPIVWRLFTREKIKQYRAKPHRLVIRTEDDMQIEVLGEDELKFDIYGITTVLPCSGPLEEMLERCRKIDRSKDHTAC